MKFLRPITFTIFTISSISFAQAFETKTGVIQSLQVFGENNFAFRIRLEGVSEMCSLGENWAYVESTDSNYQTKVSVLMSAFAMGAPITVYTEASSRNHCHLDSITNVTR